MKKPKKCASSEYPFCRNPAFVVIDFKSPTIGWKTQRVCVPCARTILADTIGTDQEAREEQARRDKEKGQFTTAPTAPTPSAGEEK